MREVGAALDDLAEVPADELERRRYAKLRGIGAPSNP